MSETSRGDTSASRNARLSKMERNWVMYDVGNSAFVLLATAVVPIYLSGLLAADGRTDIVTSFGYAQTIASLVIAVLMPILGSLADFQGQKIKFFTGFLMTGIIACLGLAMPLPWLPFIIMYVIATIGLNSSMTFYDAMLVDVTGDVRMDKVSSAGYAWGYVGSTIPFIVCLGLILGGPSFGLPAAIATRISFVITGVWWLIFSIPLLRSYHQVHYKNRSETPGHAVSRTMKGLLATLKKVVANKTLLFYMLAYFFYIDGVHTVIAMSTSYGTSLGIGSTQLVLALLVTQFIAFPSAIVYGRFADIFGTRRMIIVAVIAYMCIVLFAAFFLNSAGEFWILAIAVGLFQGGIQALSRSYLGKLVPKENANEYYGFFDMSGRYACALGTFLVAVVTQITGHAQLGVLSIGILFAAGLFCLLQMSKTDSPRNHEVKSGQQVAA